MKLFGKDITRAKLRDYVAIRKDQLRKRVMPLRKPMMRMAQPGKFYARRRARAEIGLPDDLFALRDKVKMTGFGLANQVVDRDLMSELQATADTRLANAQEISTSRTIGSKRFWHQLLRPADFASDSIFVRFALQKPVVQVVADIFGEIPHMTILELAYTHSIEQPGGPVASQRWHRDLGDSQTIKLFTYLTDVSDVDDGPFSFIPSDACRGARLPYFPIHKPDAMVRPHGLLERTASVFGPAGTSFLIDTYNCLHCGSRQAPGHRRLAMIVTYNTAFAWRHYSNGVKPVGALSPLNKMLLNI